MTSEDYLNKVNMKWSSWFSSSRMVV